jgi:sortase (surface protein transpeptidase)
MKKIIFSFLFLFIIIIGIGIGINSGYQLKKTAEQKQILSALSQNIPTKIPSQEIINIKPTPGVPVKLKIPKIGVTVSIESVGLDRQQRMDVPTNSDDAGWFRLGYKPGEKGNAVIDGHLDKVTGAPAAFWNISHLESGDRITTTDSNGKLYTFIVVNTAVYPYNNFPLQQVFGPSVQPMLNLITCQGTWDAASKNYSQREVVYAKLIK